MVDSGIVEDGAFGDKSQRFVEGDYIDLGVQKCAVIARSAASPQGRTA